MNRERRVGVSPDEFASLTAMFGSWHNPVADLLMTTDGGHEAVTLDYAFASQRVPSGEKLLHLL